MERGRNSRLRYSWKWAVAVILRALAAALCWWPSPPVKIELLPFSNIPPAWDGSQAWLIISPVAGSTPLKFKTEIAMVKPSVRHESPVNEFVVNLRNGNFKLLQTDLLTAALDGNWNVLVRNKFLNGRVSEQTLADGEVYRYEYQFNGAEVIRTTVTLPSGEKKEVFFHDGILTDQK